LAIYIFLYDKKIFVANNFLSSYFEQEEY